MNAWIELVGFSAINKVKKHWSKPTLCSGFDRFFGFQLLRKVRNEELTTAQRVHHQQKKQSGVFHGVTGFLFLFLGGGRCCWYCRSGGTTEEPSSIDWPFHRTLNPVDRPHTCPACQARRIRKRHLPCPFLLPVVRRPRQTVVYRVSRKRSFVSHRGRHWVCNRILPIRSGYTRFLLDYVELESVPIDVLSLFRLIYFCSNVRFLDFLDTSVIFLWTFN